MARPTSIALSREQPPPCLALPSFALVTTSLLVILRVCKVYSLPCCSSWVIVYSDAAKKKNKCSTEMAGMSSIYCPSTDLMTGWRKLCGTCEICGCLCLLHMMNGHYIIKPDVPKTYYFNKTQNLNEVSLFKKKGLSQVIFKLYLQTHLLTTVAAVLKSMMRCRVSNVLPLLWSRYTSNNAYRWSFQLQNITVGPFISYFLHWFEKLYRN